MLTRTYRFHGYNSLNWVYRQGATVRDPMLALRYAKNSKRTHSRAAVVVSRKISKSAVVRNRIRRRVYEILRPSLAQSNDSYDLVFTIYKVDIAELSFTELKSLIERLLKQAGVH